MRITGSKMKASTCYVFTYCHRNMACHHLHLPSCGRNLDPEGKHPDTVTIWDLNPEHMQPPHHTHRRRKTGQKLINMCSGGFFQGKQSGRSVHLQIHINLEGVATHSSFASMPPLGCVHLIVVVIVESVFCCVSLQNSLQHKTREKHSATASETKLKILCGYKLLVVNHKWHWLCPDCVHVLCCRVERVCVKNPRFRVYQWLSHDI